MPATIVFDTNILFSAAGWRGNPYRCVDLARTRQVQAVTCDAIIDELAEKLALKLRMMPDHVNEVLADYLSFHQVVEIPGVLAAVPRDPDDNAVLECAQVGSAQSVVSGDRDLLSIGNFQGIDIVTASEFLHRWEAGQIPK